MHGEKYSSDRALIDILLNLNMFMFMILIFLLAISVITVQKITEGVPVKAEYIVTAKWQDGLDCDVDLWVQDPTGVATYFRNLNVGVANLERDDRGMMGEGVTLDGVFYENPTNEEKYTIRRIVPGEYVVNVHLYACTTTSMSSGQKIESTGQPGSKADVTVFVYLDKINPSLATLKKAVLRLSKVWEEQTAFRFTLAADGTVVSYDDTPKKIVKTDRD